MIRIRFVQQTVEIVKFLWVSDRRCWLPKRLEADTDQKCIVSHIVDAFLFNTMYRALYGNYCISLIYITNIAWIQCWCHLFARQRRVPNPTPKIFRPSNQEQAYWTISNFWICSFVLLPEEWKRNCFPKYMHLFL
jgi:hypothetical protein